MAIRYYPSTKIKTNQKALVGEFTLRGVVYTGSYYSTYDGKYFTGPDPIIGTNEEIVPVPYYTKPHYFEPARSIPKNVISSIDNTSNSKNRSLTQPVSYNPIPTDLDYLRGYVTRFFVKRVNQSGYVMEISENEYKNIKNGTATYDISFYHVIEIAWKLTGPLNKKRISQYDTRAGIIDTNKRLVETADKNFRGIIEYIAGDYSKFARPTE